MNRLRVASLAALIAIASLSECSDDDKNGITSCYSPNQSVVITEMKTSDAQSTTTVLSYAFENGLIDFFESRQIFDIYYLNVRTESDEVVQTTTVAHEGSVVTMTESNGNINIYQLDEHGFATSCERREWGGTVRTYDFDYVINEGQTMLSSVTEYINGEEFSSIEIRYSGTETHVTRYINDCELAYTVSASGDGVIANTRKLPMLFLAEMHPLSLHQPALYGCMLGYPSGILGGKVTPDENLYGECVEYIYTADSKGYPTNCKIRTTSDGYTYTRYQTLEVE